MYINVAEIQVFAQDSTVLTPQPASDATLGDLRLDGETVEGFDPSKTDYTVDLPVDARQTRCCRPSPPTMPPPSR